MAQPPVLLVHGFGSSFDHGWREPGWADILADEGREVLGGDLPGHGAAAKPTDPADYADVDDAVASWRGGHDVVDAVGFSMGARILLTLAAAKPGSFRRLVVMGIGANAFGREHSDALAQAVESGETTNEVTRIFAQLAADPRNDRAALAAFLRRDTRAFSVEDAARIDVPVLVVIGERDFVWPADELVAALPDATLVTLPGVDHFATPRDFRAIDAAIRFLGAS